MADDDTTTSGGDGGGGLFEGPPIAGIPRPLAVGGAIVLGVGLLVFLWKRKKGGGASSTATTVITGSSSTGIDNAMLDAILKNWQQHPEGGSSSTATGTGGGGGGGTGPGSGTSATGTSSPPTGPNAGTTTDESGNMHGITLAQAQYLFDTGNMPYVWDAAKNEFVRWSGMPVAGQTYYAGPVNWKDTLKGGNIVGGTKGHPIFKAAAQKAKAAVTKKPPQKKAPIKSSKKPVKK